MKTETERGFAWLTEGIDSTAAVTFVPNPGNVGDAAINLACWRYLKSRFAHVEICKCRGQPSHKMVFVGGGGNMIEPLYSDVAEFIENVSPNSQLHIFPSTVSGFRELFENHGDRIRVVCREQTTFHYLQSLMPASNVYLGHDAAFALGPWLRLAFYLKARRFPEAAAKIFRDDDERAILDDDTNDIMAKYLSDWTNLSKAKKRVRFVVRYLLGFARIETDRLHCAILSTLLGRDLTLRPNSYFKNAAVFEHSLSRFANAKFNPCLEPASSVLER